MPSIKTVLCPTDFSEPSQDAFKVAVSLASDLGATLVLVNIGCGGLPTIAADPDYGYVKPEYERLEHGDAGKLSKLAEQVPKSIAVRTVLGEGDAANEIVRIAEKENADLIVMATHGMAGVRHAVLGSVAEKVVRLAKCPVLTTRAHVPELKKPQELAATAS